MDRRAAIVVLVGAVVAALFAAVTTAGEVRLVDRPPSFFDGDDSAQRPTPQMFEPTEFDIGEAREPREVSPLVEQIARLLGWTMLAIAAAVAAIVLWRHRPTFSWRRRRRLSDQPIDVLADVAEAITDGASAQRAALTRGSPRNAIVECWLLLEAAVSDAGVQRRPSDTSSELTQRVLADRDVDPAAIAELASLYRVARFSNHEISEASRRAALHALDRVHDGLRPGAQHRRAVTESA